MSAGNIKLNLKEFKHVSSDKNKTILEHKKGHRLELAHGSLSPESRQQLEELAKDSKNPADKNKMAEGGDITKDPAPMLPQGTRTHEDVSRHRKKMKNWKERQGFAEGGETPRWDQVTGPSPADPHQSNDSDYHDKTTSDQDAQRHQQADEADKRGKAMGLYAKGGGIENPAAGLDFNTAKEENEAAYNAGLPCLNPHCKSHGQPHPNCRCYSGGEAYAKGGYVEGHGNDNPSAKEEYFCDMPRHHFKSCEYAHGGEVSQQGNDVKHANREKQRGNSGAAQQQMNYAKSEAKGRAEFERQVKPNMKGLADGGKPDDAPAMEDVERGFHHQYMEPDQEPSQDEQNKGIDKEVEDAANYIDPQGVGKQSSMAPEAAPQTPPATATIQPDEKDESGYGVHDPAEFAKAQNAYNAAHQQPQQDMQQGQPSGDLSTNPIQRFVDHKQQAQQALSAEDEAWANDLRNGHIKPETYQSLFANKSTTGKLGTIFGILLSAPQSGITGQPNAVLQMMQQTIHNDLQAQMKSKDNAINYLTLGQHHAMNQANINSLNTEAAVKGYALANMYANRAALQEMVKNVSLMPPGPARDQAERQLAMLNQSVQTDNYAIGDRAATAAAYYKMLGATSGNNAQQGGEAAFQQRNKMLSSGMLGPNGEAMGRLEAARHLPGVAGAASRDVSPADSDKYNGYKTLDNQLKDLMGAVKQYSNLKGNVDPRVLGPMAVKAHEAAALYNKTLDGLGMTEGRMDWLSKQIPSNPQTFLEQLKGSKEKLEEVANNNNMRKNTMLNSYGFPAQTQGVKPKPGYKVEQHNGKNYYVPIKKK